MTTATFSDVNAFQSDVAGRHVHVGVVDSVLELPSKMEYTIDETENYVASTAPDTTGHGTKVMTVLGPFAPEATYELFRVIAEDGEFRPSNFLKAMSDVIASNVDVANVSAGKYHTDCGGRCRICEAVERVVRDGTIVVAGAGNRRSDRPLDVFCPTRSGESIAVGMSESVCTASLSDDPLPPGPTDQRPPGAYWVDSDGDADFYPDENYCSYRKCSPWHDCSDNRRVQYWDGNVDWAGYIPEVVAPGHKPMVPDDGRAEIEPGTSYSAAVVSGGVATVLSELLPDVPSPHLVKRAVEASARDIDCGLVDKFDIQELYQVLN